MIEIHRFLQFCENWHASCLLKGRGPEGTLITARTMCADQATAADTLAEASPGEWCWRRLLLIWHAGQDRRRLRDDFRIPALFLSDACPMSARENVFPAWESVAAGRVIDPADLPAATKTLFMANAPISFGEALLLYYLSQ
jgi:hypothetical protein